MSANLQRYLLFVFLLVPAISAADKKPPKQAIVSIQRTSMSRDQEAKLGQEAAAQVEREMEVVHNEEIEAWLNRIGQQLAQTPQANAYPYHFKLVNEDSINAFALPGGPMFVHTGLIKAADNEAEVAGVLAHEMSHVALRHGAAQMSKQQTLGTIFGVIGQVGGVLGGDGNGGCSMLCQATQMGAGLGSNSLLMRFSRGYEHDADLNGARMMNSAGYNPMALATFFDKLKSTQGSAGEPKGLSLWLASHPATGSRIQYVSEDIQFYPKKDFTANTGNFARVKQIVMTVPPAKLKPAALLSVIQGNPRTGLPQGMKDYAARGFSVAYPSTWQSGQAQAGSSVYLAPQGGLLQQQNSGVELIAGAMIDYYVPAQVTSLEASTREFVESLKKSDANLREERPAPYSLSGTPARTVKLFTKTSKGDDQIVYITTTLRQAGLWYIAMAVPAMQQSQFDSVFQQILSTIAFPADVP